MKIQSSISDRFFDSEPKVSVIIPCYNQGQYVTETLDSLLVQTYPNIEIVIINDGSNDQITLSILNDICLQNVQVLHTDNQGLAAARNNGIQIAAGEFILPLDSDDLIAPSYVEQAVKVLIENDDVGIVYCEAGLFGTVETQWLLPEFSLQEMLLDNVIFCSALFRRRDWKKVGGYDESFVYGWEDYDFWLSLLELGRKVYRIPEVLFYYRVSADSMVRARPRQHKLETFTRLFHKHQPLYSDNIQIWIDTLLDAKGIYHQASLQQSAGKVVDSSSRVRKVDLSTRCLEFQLSEIEESNQLLFYPSEDPVVLRIDSIVLETLVDGQQHEVEFSHNADIESRDRLYFCSRKSFIKFSLPEQHQKSTDSRIIIELEYYAFGVDCIPLLTELAHAAKGSSIQTEAFGDQQQISRLSIQTGWWTTSTIVLKKLLRSWLFSLHNSHYRILKKSGLFDAVYYQQQDPDILVMGFEPLIHYVKKGWKEERNPNPLFESSWYRQTYGVVESTDSLLHYIEEGSQNGNNPNLLFFNSWYASKYKESIKNGYTPLADYLTQGDSKLKNPNPCFDAAYYVKHNPEVLELKQDPLFHYFHIGNAELRSPMPFFDMHFYCEDNPVAHKEWLFPLLHYFEHGAAEGRSPNRLFDPSYYKNSYHLTGLSGIDIFFHFVREGSSKQYRPSVLFDPAFYAENYCQSLTDSTCPLTHYLEHGVFSGNYPCREIAKLSRKPVISLLTPVYNTDERLLRRCIHSVLYQAYPHWELCLVDDGSSAPHIRSLLEEYEAKDQRIKVKFLTENQGISGASNNAAALADGEYFAFLDHDDELTVDALYEMVQAIIAHDPDVLYSDEDLIDNDSRHLENFFKPNFNPELLFCHNYITHFLVIKSSLYHAVGGLSPDYNGAQDYDLLLKLTERSNKVYHIPKILYHWRATETSTSIDHAQKNYANKAGLQALQAAVRRRGLQADVSQGVMNYYYEVHRCPRDEPLVDILLLYDNEEDNAEKWLNNLLEITSYGNLCVCLIPNAPLSEEGEKQLLSLDKKIAVAQPVMKDNVALALNNAVLNTGGEFLCFLGEKVLPEKPDWIEKLVGYAREEQIGMVSGLVMPDESGPCGEDFLPDMGDDSSSAYHYFLTLASIHANGLFCPQDVVATGKKFCMVRKSLFRETGGFDDNAFPVTLYDLDFCFQLLERKHRNIFTPYCRAIQREGRKRLRETQSENNREKELFQRKWHKTLLLGNPFMNLQHILQQEHVTEKDWWTWFAGVTDEKSAY